MITPSVLPDDSPSHAGMPKDEDLFDQFGHRLSGMLTESDPRTLSIAIPY